jgi:hypothetical protein
MIELIFKSVIVGFCYIANKLSSIGATIPPTSMMAIAMFITALNLF